ncbi:inositol monophosphatase family protein [Staphylococcus sp. SQ8-PEA]|uniref:Inositol monophosphatase family protein n=1 Tax=Staphylococcus marylandisciuri TaxID=2981529 RepID=A0ABT2QNU5_9STAP|nr:inositol monophosphatase family protein [Staphylococcus marylandisciuri]MCU5745657.1 inositol monophosphatase family protein [Staphylococcus marylandisciuri]
MTVYEFAKGLILEAGGQVRSRMDESIQVETKSNPNDLVTNIDREVENYIYNSILDTYPDHQVIGEEGHGHELTQLEGFSWVIDPIDGTLNFVHQADNFAISIGIYKDNESYAGFVYDVISDTLYHAKKGEGAYINRQRIKTVEQTTLKTSIIGINPNWLTRSKSEAIFKQIVADARSARAYGSAALEIVNVATGKLAAYMTPRLSPWDYAGAAIILEEVNGVVTDLLGNPLSLIKPSSVIAANPQIHEEILTHYLSHHNEDISAFHQYLNSK